MLQPKRCVLEEAEEWSFQDERNQSSACCNESSTCRPNRPCRGFNDTNEADFQNEERNTSSCRSRSFASELQNQNEERRNHGCTPKPCRPCKPCPPRPCPPKPCPEPEPEPETPNCAGQVLAMAYVKEQEFDNRKLYDCDEALINGTMFTELDKPFKGGKCHD